MLRKLALFALMGLLGLGALAAGADRFMLLGLGALAALGWVGLRGKGRR